MADELRIGRVEFSDPLARGAGTRPAHAEVTKVRYCERCSALVLRGSHVCGNVLSVEQQEQIRRDSELTRLEQEVVEKALAFNNSLNAEREDTRDAEKVKRYAMTMRDFCEACDRLISARAE